MQTTRSFTFANNKGGAGKTFTLFQLSCQIAAAHPSKSVLVVDFSLYSELSSLLMGGLARPQLTSHTNGMETILQNTTAQHRAEGLVRDLMATQPSSAQNTSVFGTFFGRSATNATEPVDLLNYVVTPAEYNPHIPPNMRLVPSAGGESWRKDDNETDDVWWTSGGTEWQTAADRLERAIASLEPGSVVLFDTDHLAASPLTKIALGAADSTIVPLSLDEGDFSRLFHDPTRNALFADVMMPMARSGSLTAPVSKFVFTHFRPRTNSPMVTEEKIRTPVTPAHAAVKQMDQIVRALRGAAHASEELRACLSQCDESCFGSLFTTFKTVSDVAANVSKLRGVPLCMMHSCKDSGLSESVIQSLESELVSLMDCVLAAQSAARAMAVPSPRALDFTSPLPVGSQATIASAAGKNNSAMNNTATNNTAMNKAQQIHPTNCAATMAPIIADTYKSRLPTASTVVALIWNHLLLVMVGLVAVLASSRYELELSTSIGLGFVTWLWLKYGSFAIVFMVAITCVVSWSDHGTITALSQIAGLNW